jgi:hypothetical protein
MKSPCREDVLRIEKHHHKSLLEPGALSCQPQPRPRQRRVTSDTRLFQLVCQEGIMSDDRNDALLRVS